MPDRDGPTKTIFALVSAEAGRHRTRTWGWYSKLDFAVHDVFASNHDLIFESGTFRYAIIEEVPEGFMGSVFVKKRWWYEAIHQTDGTYDIKALPEPPEQFKGMLAISMG